MGSVGEAGPQEDGARFSKRDDGFGITRLHRSQSTLPGLPGKKVLSRTQSSITSTKAKALCYRSAHRITSFVHERRRIAARAMPPALERDVDFTAAQT
jgi:hypothetical protein